MACSRWMHGLLPPQTLRRRKYSLLTRPCCSAVSLSSSRYERQSGASARSAAASSGSRQISFSCGKRAPLHQEARGKSTDAAAAGEVAVEPPPTSPLAGDDALPAASDLPAASTRASAGWSSSIAAYFGASRTRDSATSCTRPSLQMTTGLPRAFTDQQPSTRWSPVRLMARWIRPSGGPQASVSNVISPPGTWTTASVSAHAGAQSETTSRTIHLAGVTAPFLETRS